MGLDAGTVLKRSVLCTHCNEDYYFALRAIANNPELKCLGCGGRIPLSDSIYEPLLSDVRNILEAIDSAAPLYATRSHLKPAVKRVVSFIIRECEGSPHADGLDHRQLAITDAVKDIG
jgi:hypothetical protein